MRINMKPSEKFDYLLTESKLPDADAKKLRTTIHNCRYDSLKGRSKKDLDLLNEWDDYIKK
jgi:hypothetical protein